MDGAQSIAHTPVDVQDIGADFVAGPQDFAPPASACSGAGARCSKPCRRGRAAAT
ncbi:MAG: hypothetical protein U1E77_00265 [Inhella sp.]